jgi:GTP-binding protein
MIITSISFVCSSPDLRSCPLPDRPEYAFIGRSNVGKSSLINMLTGQKNLARTSSKPGKTRLIQHYLVNGQWYLVDLPGFGYARVSHEQRLRWQQAVRKYLLKRTNLLMTFVLVDSRIEPQAVDLEIVNWLGENQIPFTLVFTKTDQSSNQKVTRTIHDFKEQMLLTWEVLPEIIETSAVNRKGKEKILDLIGETNGIFEWKGN